MPPHPDLRTYLGGAWRVVRRIVDERAGRLGRLAGTATFGPAPPGPSYDELRYDELRYDELGTLVFGQHRGPAACSYRFVPDGPASASVRFADGRPFYQLSFRLGQAAIRHDCAADRYRGECRIVSADTWTLTWRIEGPRKRMLIRTRYRRAASGLLRAPASGLLGPRAATSGATRLDRHADAARLLLSARCDPAQRLRSLPTVLAPRTEEQAYLVQREIMAELGPIGGWKVGSPSPDGAFTCAPLPASGLQDSPGRAGAGVAVEAEIAVRLGADLPARDAPYTEAEVLAAIASAHPAIEVLRSRFAEPDAVGPLSGLADSGGHDGLVLGPAIPDWRAVDLAAERVRVLVGGAEVKSGVGNPGGGMGRLLAWLANEGARWAGGLRAGQVVTTGSWTGKDPAGAEVRVRFERAGEAVLDVRP